MARLLLALVAAGLLCRLAVVDAACCTTGQPTYAGSGLNVQGVPTCSDGPCSGPGFKYAGDNVSESPDPDSCCDTEDSGFTYNPPAGSEGKWPGIPDFPISLPPTGQTCDIEKPRYRCTIGGQAVQAPSRRGNGRKLRM